MERELWGVAFILSPLIILVVLLTCPGSKWVAPLIAIVPFTIHYIIMRNFMPFFIFQGVAVAVSLYGLYILLVVFVGVVFKLKRQGF